MTLVIVLAPSGKDGHPLVFSFLRTWTVLIMMMQYREYFVPDLSWISTSENVVKAQGSLPVDFVCKEIPTIDKANAFLWEYLPKSNAQFSLKDEKELDLSTFLESTSEAEIKIILAVVSQCINETGHRIKYHNSYHQPCLEYPSGLIPRFFLRRIGTKTLGIKAFDGTLLANSNEELEYALSDILRNWEKESRSSQHDAHWRF